MKRAIQILSGLMIVLSFVVAFQFRQIAHQDEKQVEAIRKIMCFANHQVQTSKQRTAQEKANALIFYNQALALVAAKPCPEEL